jgi:hypothetical protein
VNATENVYEPASSTHLARCTPCGNTLLRIIGMASGIASALLLVLMAVLVARKLSKRGHRVNCVKSCWRGTRPEIKLKIACIHAVARTWDKRGNAELVV